MGLSYVPLRLRSNYSLLCGTARLEDIIAQAVQQNLPAVALTDENNLYGAVDFYLQAHDAGIKPIIGAVVTHAGGAVTLLVRDLRGYANLCRIITQRQLDAAFHLPETVAAHQEGLFVLCEDPELLASLVERVDRGRLWVELVRPGRSGMHIYQLRDFAARHELGVVATGDVHFLNPSDHGLHRLLAAMRTQTLLTTVPTEQTAVATAYLADAREMASRYQEFPEALSNTLHIADACNLELPMGRPIFPRYPLPSGRSVATVLKEQCHAGLPGRYGTDMTAAHERLQYELKVIIQLGFAEYFLVVGDIVRYARSQGVPVVGRGSGASSIVAYLMGITSVDPLKYNLPFERFLNPSRRDCPDLDIDFCWKSRDEVIDYVYRTYGAARVEMISTHNTFQRRSALRETAKVFGLSNQQITAIARRFLYDDRSLTEALRVDGEALPIAEEILRAIADYAERLVGFPHHLSIHCGGIVIGDQSLSRYVPLEQASKGIVVTQYEMNAIEQIGLVKIDLLGNRALSAVRDTVNLLAEQQGIQIDPEALPESDPSTLHCIQTAATIGCCQLESPAMRRLITMLRPESIGRIIQALALIRPAPSAIGMQAAFVRRARGLEPAVFPHPSLESILSDTFGVLLYEDDAMLVANCVAELSYEEGDRFRKAIKKSRTRKNLLATWHFFRRHALDNGVDEEIAKTIWVQMAKFNKYSFCRAHAAGYGLVAYQSAFLKTHYPAAYMVAALNNVQGLYPRRVHVWEAKRMGLEVRLPSVNDSGIDYTLEGEAIRIGLNQIKGLSQQAMEQILSQRAHEPFVSVSDFLARVRCSLSELESLILIGGFDGLGLNRAELSWQAHSHFGKIARQRTDPTQEALLYCPPTATMPPPLPDHDLHQRVGYELAILECPVSAHPVALLRRALEDREWTIATALPKLAGQTVRLLGIQDAARTVSTRHQQDMRFVTFEDESGVFEACLFPDVYRRLRGRLQGPGPYLVEGTVEELFDTFTITAQNIRSLDPGNHQRTASSLQVLGARHGLALQDHATQNAMAPLKSL